MNVFQAVITSNNKLGIQLQAVEGKGALEGETCEVLESRFNSNPVPLLSFPVASICARTANPLVPFPTGSQDHNLHPTLPQTALVGRGQGTATWRILC